MTYYVIVMSADVPALQKCEGEICLSLNGGNTTLEKPHPLTGVYRVPVDRPQENFTLLEPSVFTTPHKAWAAYRKRISKALAAAQEPARDCMRQLALISVNDTD